MLHFTEFYCLLIKLICFWSVWKRERESDKKLYECKIEIFFSVFALLCDSDILISDFLYLRKRKRDNSWRRKQNKVEKHKFWSSDEMIPRRVQCSYMFDDINVCCESVDLLVSHPPKLHVDIYMATNFMYEKKCDNFIFSTLSAWVRRHHWADNSIISHFSVKNVYTYCLLCSMSVIHFQAKSTSQRFTVHTQASSER